MAELKHGPSLTNRNAYKSLYNLSKRRPGDAQRHFIHSTIENLSGNQILHLIRVDDFLDVCQKNVYNTLRLLLALNSLFNLLTFLRKQLLLLFTLITSV